MIFKNIYREMNFDLYCSIFHQRINQKKLLCGVAWNRDPIKMIPVTYSASISSPFSPSHCTLSRWPLLSVLLPWLLPTAVLFLIVCQYHPLVNLPSPYHHLLVVVLANIKVFHWFWHKKWELIFKIIISLKLILDQATDINLY